MPEHQADELPESLDAWVEERATASEADSTAIIARAVALYRLVEEQSMQGDESLSAVEAVGERLDELEAASEQLTARVRGVEDDLDEKITDVRERVIQIKRETDEKALKDHEHPALVDRLESIEVALDDLEAVVDTGFERREEILTHLADETADLNDETAELREQFTKLAGALNDARQRVEQLEQQVSRRDALDGLKRSANRQGIRKGQCGSCENPITVGLLTEPNCPHCEETFTDIDPPGRFFGTATLNTGDFPALTADSPASESAGGANRDTEGTDEPVPETVSELFDHTGEPRDD